MSPTQWPGNFGPRAGIRKGVEGRIQCDQSSPYPIVEFLKRDFADDRVPQGRPQDVDSHQPGDPRRARQSPEEEGPPSRGRLLGLVSPHVAFVHQLESTRHGAC